MNIEIIFPLVKKYEVFYLNYYYTFFLSPGKALKNKLFSGKLYLPFDSRSIEISDFSHSSFIGRVLKRQIKVWFHLDFHDQTKAMTFLDFLVLLIFTVFFCAVNILWLSCFLNNAQKFTIEAKKDSLITYR